MLGTVYVAHRQMRELGSRAGVLWPGVDGAEALRSPPTAPRHKLCHVCAVPPLPLGKLWSSGVSGCLLQRI